MADSGGHWSTLAQAQKLTESTKIPGVFETDIKRNNPLDRVPVAQAAHSGKSIKFLREAVTLDDDVQDLAVGEKLTWTEDVTYDEVEVPLKIKALQRKLDQFVRDIYGTYNDYRAQVLLEMEKGIKRKIGDAMIYNDVTYGGANQFDGMHAQAALQTGTNLDIDGGETGLSLADMRTLEQNMKQGISEWWIPYPIVPYINAAYEEAGFSGLAYNSAGALAMITRGISDIGKHIMFWNGVPFVPTDYLMLETDDVGDGSDLRSKDSDGSDYSIFAVLLGDVMAREPGMTLAYGGTEGMGDFYKLVPFPNLEDYDAEGMRMVSYISMLFSSKYAVSRIFDVQASAITAQHFLADAEAVNLYAAS